MDLTIVKLPALPTRPYHPGQPLVPCYAPQGQRFPDNSVDMGTGFDCFDTLAHTDDPRIQGAQRANRQFLKSTLEAQGFVNLPEEWWHFTYQPETVPRHLLRLPRGVALRWPGTEFRFAQACHHGQCDACDAWFRLKVQRASGATPVGPGRPLCPLGREAAVSGSPTSD